MARKKAVAVEVVEAPAVLTEESSLSVEEALQIVAEAEKTVSEAFAKLEASGSSAQSDGSNGEVETVPEVLAPAPVLAPKSQVQEFSCKFGDIKSVDEWKFCTERIEFRGLIRTTVKDDMALVRAGVVCKKHVDAIRKEAMARGVDAPWFFRLSATLEKVKEREGKRTELKAEAEAERLELDAKRLAEQEAMRVEVGSYLKKLQADKEKREEKLQREREDQRKRHESFRKKDKYSYSGPREWSDDNGRRP